jgi:hypothetical protein
MSKQITLLLLLCLLPTLVIGDGRILRDFTAAATGQQALLEWNTNPGATPVLFRVQRSLDGHRFYFLATVAVKAGVTHYSYLDTDFFKGEWHTYYYRLEVVLPNGSTEMSEVAEVTLSFSGIQRTWGSIKAMFR